MTTMTSSVTEKGEVALPVVIREQLGLKPNDKVILELHDGEVRVRPARSRILAAFGAVTPLARPEDFRAIREQFEHDVADDVLAETEYYGRQMLTTATVRAALPGFAAEMR